MPDPSRVVAGRRCGGGPDARTAPHEGANDRARRCSRRCPCPARRGAARFSRRPSAASSPLCGPSPPVTGGRRASQETQTGPTSTGRCARCTHRSPYRCSRGVASAGRRRSRTTANPGRRRPRTTDPFHLTRPRPPEPDAQRRDEPLTAAPAPQSLGPRPWTRRPFGMLSAFIERVPTPSSAPPRPWDASSRALTQPAQPRTGPGRAAPSRAVRGASAATAADPRPRRAATDGCRGGSRGDVTPPRPPR